MSTLTRSTEYLSSDGAESITYAVLERMSRDADGPHVHWSPDGHQATVVWNLTMELATTYARIL